MKPYITHPLFTDEIYQYFDIHFQNHSDFLENLVSQGYVIDEFYFREILSWEFETINFDGTENDVESMRQLLFSVRDTKSELVPVLILREKDTNTHKSIYVELHSENNAF